MCKRVRVCARRKEGQCSKENEIVWKGRGSQRERERDARKGRMREVFVSSKD